MEQLSLFINDESINTEVNIQNTTNNVKPFSAQLLKWVGNKQKFAYEIINYFPKSFGTYFEPFLGSGGVLATLSPNFGIASDSYCQLIEIFQTLKNSPTQLLKWYSERWDLMTNGNKKIVYEEIKASYNRKPNAADLLFISRSCYGGVVRFRLDGYLSTPVGAHDPITPASFSKRIEEWHLRVKNTNFYCADFEKTMNLAKAGDLIYCDPPYSHSQSILYGSQTFDFEKLLSIIDRCKKRGVFVILSIDGTKKSGNYLCALPIPNGLFEREVYLKVGRSMLKRFQMEGKTLEGEVVKDRLLITY